MRFLLFCIKKRMKLGEGGEGWVWVGEAATAQQGPALYQAATRDPHGATRWEPTNRPSAVSGRWRCLPHHHVQGSRERGSQPTNQPTNRPTDQQTNQPANPPTSQPANFGGLVRNQGGNLVKFRTQGVPRRPS